MLKTIRSMLALLALALCASIAHADPVGVVEQIINDPTNGTFASFRIYFVNQSSTMPGCSYGYISETDYTLETRNEMRQTLRASKFTGNSVQIGVTNTSGNCKINYVWLKAS